MLPLPDLDDRRFKEIIEDARRLIPRIIPQWTDMNYHDPGITLIDLLAWLVEMQQYHLNRITVANELKFLQLLGVKPRKAAHARAYVSFDKAEVPVFLPGGTQLGAGDRIFETEAALYIHPARLEKIIAYSELGTSDYTPFNNSRALSFYAFGSQAKRQNCLYIGFDKPLTPGQPVSLMLQLYTDYPVAAGNESSGDSEMLTTAEIAWKYYGSPPSSGSGTNRETEAWLPLEIIADETRHFYKSGSLSFRVPGLMKATKLSLASERPYYLLCAELVREGYEIPPRVQEVSINTVLVRQRQTLAEVSAFFQ